MDLMELVVKIKADTEGLSRQLDEAKGVVNSFGSGAANILGGIGKTALWATGAAVAGVSAITKKSVDAYKEFQQLEGGVETLFGAGGQSMEEYAQSMGASVSDIREEYNQLMEAEKIVMENAKTAYNDAGLSMNAYMEQATTMSASLKQSLEGDTVAAAKYADMAIKDMSDNANKMGTNIQAIQNAYQGFSKQNYTMLDNLKLGYGGTKKEMERLLKDAEQIKAKNGEIVEYSIESYADIVDAIHTVQEETGIYGTTTAEAAETISGSMASVSAAWENVLTTMASGDDAELGTQITNFTKSATTAVNNLIPTISTALKGVGTMVKEIAPVLAKELPGLIKDVLPNLISAAITMLKTAIPVIAKELPGIIKEILPELVKGFVELFAALVEEFPTIIEGLIEAFEGIGEVLLETLDEYFPGAKDAIESVIKVFEELEPVIWAVVGAFVAYKAALLISEAIAAVSAVISALQLATEGQTAAQVLLNIATMQFPGTWIVAAIGAVIGVLVYLWTTSEDFRDACIRVWELVWGAIQGAADIIVAAFGAVIEWIGDMYDSFVGFFEDGVAAWSELWEEFGNWCQEIWTNFTDWVDQKVQDIIGWFEDLTESWESFCQKFSSLFAGPADEVSNKIVELAGTAETELGGLKNESYAWGYDMTSSMSDGIERAKNEKLKKQILDVANYVHNHLHFSRPDEGPLRDYETWMPDFMHGLATGIENNSFMVKDAISDLSDSMIVEPTINPTVNGDLAASGAGGDIIIPIYLPDGGLWEEIVINSQNQHNYRQGGR